MLVNWLGSSLGEELKQVTDWKQIIGRLCSHLLSLGVIRQVTDKDVPSQNQFRVYQLNGINLTTTLFAVNKIICGIVNWYSANEWLK